MNKYKVVVYAICKNEEKFVDRWMDSMSEADLVVVLDTGSTDNTVKKLKKRKAKVYTEIISPWRFDVARNKSLEKVPQDADICVCTDLDEVFEKGWRAKLEAAWQPDTMQGRYLYNWSLDSQGKPLVQFNYFKVHARHGFYWKNPVHEYLASDKRPVKSVFIEGMVLNHYPDPNKSRGNYIELLELGAKENPNDDRSIYYLGREYRFLRRYEDAIKTLERYLTLPTAVWNDERAAAMRELAHCYAKLNNPAKAYSYYLRAIAEQPNTREAYAEYIMFAYDQKDFVEIVCMSELMFRIKRKSQTYVNQPHSWDETVPDRAAIACYNLGMIDKAYEYGKMAYELNPSDERLKKNLEFYQNKVDKKNSKDSEQ